MAFCANCGNQVNDGVAFCPKCGNAVNGAPNAQQQVNQPQQQCNEYREEETMKTWQKIVCILVWPAGAILTIVSFAKKQTALAKSALIYTIIGLVLSMVIQVLLG